MSKKKTNPRDVAAWLLTTSIYVLFIWNASNTLLINVFPTSEMCPLWTIEQTIGYITGMLMATAGFFLMLYLIYQMGCDEGRLKKRKSKKKIRAGDVIGKKA